MKSLPIALDRLLANPSYERIDGKLIKVFEDLSRIILELKGKKLKTLLGPFADADWSNLEELQVVAFVKAGENTAVYDAKAIPKALRTVNKPGVAGATPQRRTSKPKAETALGHQPKLRWKKYAEGRMVGEPVKLVSMERGFELEMDLIMGILEHLEIKPLTVTKALAYLDFRRVFHFLCEPGFKQFQANFVPKAAKPDFSLAASPEPEDALESSQPAQPFVEKKVENPILGRPKVERKQEPNPEPRPQTPPRIEEKFRPSISKIKKTEPKDHSEEE